ncbi:MAG TPA: hypothetical protein VMN35_06415 [Gaiellaceae bacterium]|nr:hypothetical protein [Gaiellaceae bacterium]
MSVGLVVPTVGLALLGGLVAGTAGGLRVARLVQPTPSGTSTEEAWT